MALQSSYPGVYVHELNTGMQPIEGVSTSIGLFIGTSGKGPINRPVRCLDYTFFENNFSDNSEVTSQLSQYVKLFFLNGGTDCYIMRIAQNAASSSVTLRNETNTNDALILTAKDMGVTGNDIRAIVTYTGPQPEITFTLELYMWELKDGMRTIIRQEIWENLSMDPLSDFFAPTFITENSQLVNATLPAEQAALIQGTSQSGRPIQHQSSAADFKSAIAALIGNASGAHNCFMLPIDGKGLVTIDLNKPVLDFDSMITADTLFEMQTIIALEIKTRILEQFQVAGFGEIDINVAFLDGPNPVTPATTTSLLCFTSTNYSDITISPADTDDLAIPLMLGTAQGGLEISSRVLQRPAPNGITLRCSDPDIWLALANLQQNAFTPVGDGITLDQFTNPPDTNTTPTLVAFSDLVTNSPTDFFYQDAIVDSPNGNNDGVRDKLRRMAAAVNNQAATDPMFRWTALVSGTRLTILPTEEVDDNFLSNNFTVTVFPAENFLNNVKAYTLGAGGLNIGNRQVAGTTGYDGIKPGAVEYDNAYTIADKEIDLFNLLILPPDDDPAAISVHDLYANASVFCKNRRAFLLMDPLPTWTDAQTATDEIAAIREGLVKDYSAIFIPQLTISENSINKNIGPAGALAGVFARIDTNRGVWKAPAGRDADIRGVAGLSHQFSDSDNSILNPKAINTLRVFSNGVVNWGARTNYGSDETPNEFKYIPVRRTALFIEESLYRGLKWVAFEPNDEPLWAKIRLNVGEFMHTLFRQGAFIGNKSSDAYFVKCDVETTTQNDIDQGIVNILVGFAPQRPAEFVVLYIQQIACKDCS